MEEVIAKLDTTKIIQLESALRIYGNVLEEESRKYQVQGYLNLVRAADEARAFVLDLASKLFMVKNGAGVTITVV